jgi:acetate---CoA ligase (ADP-forming)
MKSESQSLSPSGIEYFFNPKSIAIVGASANLAKLSGRPIDALLQKKFAGEIYPINPRYEEVAGLRCYPSVGAVPGTIDLAIISVPIEGTLDALRQCADKGVKAAVVFTSGFAETGDAGSALQARIADIARKSSMRVLGPNCLGLIYYPNTVMASFSDIMFVDGEYQGSLGFITQSGAYGEKTFMLTAHEGVGFSAFISVGNEADLQFSDFIAHLIDDESTRLFGVYLEGAKDGLKFRRAAEAALAAGKPVLIKKVGKTRAGTRAAQSHTGSLAGNDRIYDAFFRQTGIIRIDELRDLTYFALAHQSGRMPQGKNAAILTDSGGPGVELADRCEEFGLNVPELSRSTRVKIQAAIPAYGSARNPIDMTAAIMTDQELYGKCLRAIFADENIDIVFAPGVFMSYVSPKLLDETLEIYHASSKPMVLCPVWADASPQSQAMVARVRKEGIPMIPEASDAARAMAAMVWYAGKRRTFVAGTGRRPRMPAGARKKAKTILQKPEAFTEYESKQVLAACGIPVTREEPAASAKEAVAVARRIGYPVALKVLSPDIRHKTEADGIRLGLRTDKAVRDAFAEIMQNAKAYAPGAAVSGVLVQEMLGEGVEVIVGVTRDPVFGPCVMFGLGGVFVEVLQDVSFRVAPLSANDAEEMIREVKGARMLAGVRGKPASDRKALIDVILRVSELAVDFSDQIEELDINPLIVFPKGARVADALMVKKDHVKV